MARRPLSYRVADAFDAFCDGRGAGKKEHQALALCDAAPDLLSALDEAHSELGQMLSANDEGGACDRAVKKAMRRAERAMKKARRYD